MNNSIRLPHDPEYRMFEVTYQRAPEEYNLIFTLAVIPIVSIGSLFAERYWRKNSRKTS
jgi:hypothetical protein